MGHDIEYKNIVYKLPHELSDDLKPLDPRKLGNIEKISIGERQSLILSLLSRNKTLVLGVRNYAKADIKYLSS